MGKIMCEICGTVYPDSADSCPICGYSRDMGDFGQGADLLSDEQSGAPQVPQSEYDQSFFEDLGIDMSEFQDGPVEEQPYQAPQYEQPQQPQYQAPQYEQPQYRQQYQQPQQPQYSQPGYSQPREPQNGHKRAIFDYDAVNPQDRRESYNTYEPYQDVSNEVTLNDYPEDSYDNYDNYNQKPKSHAGLIVFLILLILLLIGASAFLLFKFVLPNLNPEPVVPETVVTEAPTTMPTTEPVIPCTGLTLVDGSNVELTKEGQFFLIHASVSPEDTTDTLTYQSQDESIVIVDEGGKITAVGEGETAVVLTCGDQTISMPVSVRYQAPETQPAETAAAEVAAQPEAAEAAEASATEASAAPSEQAGESQAAESEATDDGLKNVELKLKKTDLMSGVRGVSFRLELDCDLEPNEVTWSSTDTGVAQVKDGVVTTIGNGTCKIVAKYGSQEASCVIRCTFP